MKIFAKRALAYLLIVSMLATSVMFGSISTSAAPSDYPTITVGTPVSVASSSNYTYYTFVPEESGTYSFYSAGDVDPKMDLYDYSWNWIISSDDDGVGLNFSAICYLEGGEEYILELYSYSGDGAGYYTVNIEKTVGISSIVVDPISMYEGSGMYDSYWPEEGEGFEDYCEYDWWNKLSYEVTMENGDTLTGQGLSFQYNGVIYHISYRDDQSYYNRWSAGNTYIAELYIFGYIAEVSVEIVESPVDRIEADPIRLVQNTHGQERYEYNPETGEYEPYYYYSWREMFSGTVYMKDGTYVYCDGYGFYYNDEYFNLYCTDDQSVVNPWLCDNTYVATVKALGCESTASIEIIDSPIDHIEIKPVSMIEGNGYYDEYWPEEEEGSREYCCYDWWNYLEYTVTMDNGDTVKGQGTCFEYDGMSFDINFRDDQSYYNQWVCGNTYAGEIYVNGYSTSVLVEIVEDPIDWIEVHPASILKDTHGYTRYDHNLGVEYYVYDLSQIFTYTVYFKDGTSARGNGYGFEYDGTHYSVNYEPSQRDYESRWIPGNTYTQSFSIFTHTAEASISILDVFIESLTVEPISFPEYTCGYYLYNAYLYRYYYHDWKSAGVNYTAIMYDGTEIRGNTKNQRGIAYQDYYESFAFSDDQSYENQWGVGEHTAWISIAGITVDVPVEITPFPYTDIEIVAVDTVYENDYLYVDSDGNAVYSMPEFVFKLTDLEGNVVKGYSKIWDGVSMEVISNQYEQPWTVDGDNFITVFMGPETDPIVATGDVIMKDAPDYEYIEQNGGIIITGCYLTDEVLEIPSTIDGKTVVGIMDLTRAKETAKTVIIPDTVTTIAESAFRRTVYGDPTPVLEELVVGKGVTYLNYYMFAHAINLQNITISEENPYMSSLDGNVYNKAGDTLLIYILSKGNVYTVPSHVTNIDVLNNKYYDAVRLEFAEGSDTFRTIDGVTYTTDMKKVVSCSQEKTGDYVMPDTVTEIADFAFEKSALSSVVISPNVTEISYGAFIGSESLESVDLPDGLVSIERSAFDNCYELSEADIPSSVTTIGTRAFCNNSLTDVTIPAGVETVEAYSFYSNDITTLTISDGVKYIAESAFAYNPIEDLFLPESIITVGDNAFDETEISTLQLNPYITSIGYAAFSNTNISSIRFPESLEYIGDRAFANTLLRSVEVPSNVTNLGSYVFSGCYDLTEFTLGESITFIPDGTFSNTGITDLIIPSHVTAIGSRAFANTQITEANIPDNVEYLGDYIFADCYYLNSFTLPRHITTIPNGAFAYTAIEELTVPDHITMIGANAFEATLIRELVVENENIVIGANAFSGCPLDDIYLGNGITKIDMYTFSCISAESITLPESVTEIAYGAFSGSYNLLDIDIPESVVSVGPYAFSGTAWERQAGNPAYLEHVLYSYSGNDTEFTVKDGTTVLADLALEGAYLLEEVTLPEGLKTIGKLSFYGCDAIESIDIPASVNRIDECAFAMCNSLKAINVDPDNPYYTSVDGVLFNKDMTELIWCPQRVEDEYTVPASVERIKSYAFGASFLTTVIINNDDIILEGGSLDSIRTGWDRAVENIIVVKCNKGSAAYEYAVSNGMEYIANEVIRNGWISEDGKWVYYENNVKLTNQWKQDSNGWCYLGDDGYMVTNKWVKDSKGWCYVGANGYMVYNKWIKDSTGWCYVGANGYMVYNKWVKDSTGWCHVGANGYMEYNKWIKDSTGWCYVGSNGYMEYNKWIRDSMGWCHVGANGYMEYNKWIRDSIGWCHVGANGYMEYNKWVKDSTGWCYVGANGYMEYNKWIRDSIGWCHVGANGYMEYNKWIRDSIGWCYVGSSGYMIANGWVNSGGQWYYMNASGYMVTGRQYINGRYYTFNSSGVWIG